MQYRTLAPRRSSGTALVYDVKHGRPRAKVKRYEFADKAITGAWHLSLSHSTHFDVIVSNPHAWTPGRHQAVIGQQSASGNASKISHISDME
jgi:hypothetical protein